MYTGVEGLLKRSFMWRNGCPCGIKIENIADEMNKKNIGYMLIKIGKDLENMS